MIEAWKDDSSARILKNKTVYANYNNCCYKYRAENGVIISMEEEQLFSSHEEAYNRMFFHLNHALPGSTVVMPTGDPDSLVIALGYKHFFNTLEIWSLLLLRHYQIKNWPYILWGKTNVKLGKNMTVWPQFRYWIFGQFLKS